MKALRYLRLLWVQLRASLLLSVQYRYDFLIDGAISVFWTLTALAPLFAELAEAGSLPTASSAN